MKLIFAFIHCKRKTQSFFVRRDCRLFTVGVPWSGILIKFYWKRRAGKNIVKSKRRVVMEQVPLQQHLLSFLSVFSVWYSAQPLEHSIWGNYTVIIQDAIVFNYSLPVTIARITLNKFSLSRLRPTLGCSWKKIFFPISIGFTYILVGFLSKLFQMFILKY